VYCRALFTILMKVKFLKDHLDNKQGDTIDVHEDRANYWERTGVAEKTEKKTISNKKEKNSNAGPNG
jgi:hypothetical protein